MLCSLLLNSTWQLTSIAPGITQVETQYEHQKAFPNAVVIVYDPFRTTMGRLALKAFRLTRDFMEAYGQQKKIDERRY